jgi:hypothetical protein
MIVFLHSGWQDLPAGTEDWTQSYRRSVRQPTYKSNQINFAGRIYQRDAEGVRDSVHFV